MAVILADSPSRLTTRPDEVPGEVPGEPDEVPEELWVWGELPF